MAAGEESHHADGSTSDASDDEFEFCVVSSVAVAAQADELFSNGKLLPLRPSSGSDGPTYVRSESAAGGFGSRSDSRSASSSGSSSGCVSRSQSSNSASSDPARRSLSSSLFYAHPSPSPQLRWARPRRSTGSAPPPAAWGILRLGVVGAPEVYPPPRAAETKNAAVARGGGSGRSARFEHSSASEDRKIGRGRFGDGFGCKCSPDAIEPVRRQVAPAAGKQGRKKDGVRRSRILHWLEELSVTKEKKK